METRAPRSKSSNRILSAIASSPLFMDNYVTGNYDEDFIRIFNQELSSTLVPSHGAPFGSRTLFTCGTAFKRSCYVHENDAYCREKY